MGERKPNNTENNYGSGPQLYLRFPAFTAGRSGILKSIAILLIVLCITVQAYPQTEGFFAVNPIIETVQKRFKLNKKELDRISPLIKQENIDVLRIYTRFSGREPEYSSALWQEIILRRIDFESRISVVITIRQKAALKAARTEFEDRLLNIVVDDFVNSLGQFLELNVFEMEAAQNILYWEYKRKHRLIVNQFEHLSFVEKELEAISAETERSLRLILSPDQFRNYKSLSTRFGLLAGVLKF